MMMMIVAIIIILVMDEMEGSSLNGDAISP
jgi:hypothetical protein